MTLTKDLDPALQTIAGDERNMRLVVAAYMRDLADRIEDPNSKVLDLWVIEHTALDSTEEGEACQGNLSGWMRLGHEECVGEVMARLATHVMKTAQAGVCDAVTATSERCERIGRRMYEEGALNPLGEES